MKIPKRAVIADPNRRGATYSEWVECSALMPPDDSLYMVYAPSADPDKPMIGMAWYEPNGFGWSLLPRVWCDAITHWARLPLPPNAGVVGGDERRVREVRK